MQLKKGLKRIEIIIKMVNKFTLTVVHFAPPNPMQSVHARRFTAGQKTVENQDRAARPSRAVGRGPLGRSGPWAAGLLVAKPEF